MRRKSVLFSWCALLALISLGCSATEPKCGLPEVDTLPWLNTSRVLSEDDLRGKVVILDFWTYGCVNCMHVLPDLAKLEKDFGNKLAIISVHSPKFDNEAKLEFLQKIVPRYQIHHPVVNDVDFRLWNHYGARAWPTFVVLNPKLCEVGQLAGEGHYQALHRTTEILLEEYAALVQEKPVPIQLEKTEESFLSAPGKVLAQGDLIIVSDTLHHRIVIKSKNTLKVVGSGEAGFTDGAAEQAQFNSPQGLALQGNLLYVADTSNHALRLIDISSGAVSTLAGTGKLGRSFKINEPLTTDLRSPWDLAIKKNLLFIAMAGSHQIWYYDLTHQKLGIYAGSGRENIDDGPRESATFSQPSGLSISGDQLYIADSEDSGLRVIDLKTGTVNTLVGTGLFDFGDVEGEFAQAKLQHPLGVAAEQTKVYLADTYNHKIKIADLTDQVVETHPAHKNGLTLNEPGGIALNEGNLYVTDTNNNRIVVIAPADSSNWKEYKIQ